LILSLTRAKVLTSSHSNVTGFKAVVKHFAGHFAGDVHGSVGTTKKRWLLPLILGGLNILRHTA
jgi:hypothetical protein